MKRKLFALLTALLLSLALPLTAFANETPALVVDSAELFTADEAAALEAKAQALRSQYEMDVVILTVNSLDGSRPQDFADDFFDENGYGYGENYSGALFLLSMGERDWYISTSGDAIYALTDYSIQASAEEALSYFGEGDYYGGFNAWLDVLPLYFDALRDGSPIDGYADYSEDYYHGDQEEVVYYEETSSPNIFLSLIIGLAVASISLLVMRAGMNTKRPQGSAASYLVQDSYRLNTREDVFLYSNVTKQPRPQKVESHSSGGGSSIHTSSSGRSHGGGGGKF